MDSYRQISARLGAAKMFEAGFDASVSATFGIHSHREENAVFSYKYRRVHGNTDWLYSYKQNEVGLSLVRSF